MRRRTTLWNIKKVQKPEVFFIQEVQGLTRAGHRNLAPNGCMIIHNSRHCMSGKAILSAENSGKPLGGRELRPEPRCVLTALPKLSSYIPKLSTIPQEPHLQSRLSASIFRQFGLGPVKNSGARPWESVYTTGVWSWSNNNAYTMLKQSWSNKFVSFDMSVML